MFVFISILTWSGYSTNYALQGTQIELDTLYLMGRFLARLSPRDTVKNLRVSLRTDRAPESQEYGRINFVSA